MADEYNIPDKFVRFGEELGKLLDKYDFDGASFKVHPGYSDSWRDQVEYVWLQGRHGEEKRRVRITSTVIVQHKWPREEKAGG